MFKQLFLLIYFIVLGLISRTENIAYILYWILFGLIILALVPVYKKIRKSSIKNHIKNFPNTPVLNVNRASWWELEELPGILKVQAKKIVWIRKHNGIYKSKDDFFTKNNLQERKILENLISL